MLDATPLGRLAHRRPDPVDLRRLEGLIATRTAVLIPETADYEVRRSLLLHGLRFSLQQLDFLKARLIYVPISTAAILGPQPSGAKHGDTVNRPPLPKSSTAT